MNAPQSFARANTLADAVAAYFAADSAMNIQAIATAPDWQFNQLEGQYTATREAAVEALQREGIPRKMAERMLP
jgi:hypothetical protein